MNERYKEFGYEITTDPGFMDKQNAMTPELRNEMEPLYVEILEEKGSKKTIGKILRFIEKHPKNPQLKNYLSVAYKENGNMKKAREVNRWIQAEHPDYLFGKLNQAAEYFENKEYEKMTEVLGRMMEIQDLYPDRKVFHLSEVTAFYRFAIMYFTVTGNYEVAESRYKILAQIAPDDPDTQQAFIYLLPGRMKAGQKRWEEEEKTKIKVKSAPAVNVQQTNKPPEFFHEEIKLLYSHGLYIGKDNLDKILALPRETLILDLEKVLQDCMSRYEYFKSWLKTNGWDEETMSFAIHAMYLLGELRTGQSLDVVLQIFRQGEEFLAFWFSDFITDNLWEPLYNIAGNQTEKLKGFVLEPNWFTFIRSEVSNTLSQIAYHHPERRDEVICWYKDVFQFFIKCKIEDNVIDSDTIALMISDVIHLNADSLTPEIEKLYELGYVSIGISGDLQSVLKDLKAQPEYDHKNELLNIYDRYNKITTTWAGYTDDDDDEIMYDDFDDYEDIPEMLPVRKEPKIGRNDPCPCGSGKKYKKCCMNKDK